MPVERPTPKFSPRERQLLDYAAQGFTDTAIAQKLGISEATVGTYWGRVRIKLGPYSRTELVAIVMRAEREEAVEALREENLQLMKQIQELAGSDEGSLYQSLLENAPDAMILVSENGLIEYANRAANELFGYEAGELDGSDLVVLVPPRFRDMHRLHRQQYIADPKRRQMGEHLETPAVRKDGSEFSIRAALSATQTAKGLLVTCAVRAAS